MPLPPLLAAQAAGKAQKALTGDLYVRRWQSVKKRPKGKGGNVTLDHELHINPIMVILGLGAAATAGVVALWMGQRKLSYDIPEGGAKLHYIVKQYDVESHLETVVDEPAVPAWDEEIRDYYLVADSVPIINPNPYDEQGPAGGGGAGGGVPRYI